MIFIYDNIINPIVLTVGQKGVIGSRWYWLILLEQLTEEYSKAQTSIIGTLVVRIFFLQAN